MKWQDFLEEEKNGGNMFRIGAKIHFSEKNILGFSAHFKGNYVENVIAFSNKIKEFPVSQCGCSFGLNHF